MKETLMRKLIIKKIIKGLLYGCAMFVCAFVLIDICLDNSLSVLPHQYTRIAIGAVVIGIGFVTSSLIYDEDRLPFAVRGLIQFGICAAVLVIGYLISGGIPDGTGLGTGAVFFLVEVGFGLIIWLANLICFFREARLIRRKLQERLTEPL
ncbi:MAG: DUF3021 family protein [Bacillota bacterium]